jgi:hypothetical protein
MAPVPQQQMLLPTFHTMVPLVLPLLRYDVNNMACSFFDKKPVKSHEEE